MGEFGFAWAGAVMMILLQEKLASNEVNDPFVHQLVAKIQSTLEDVKVCRYGYWSTVIQHWCACVDWFSGAVVSASCCGYDGCHCESPGTVSDEGFFQPGKATSHDIIITS